MMVAWWDTITPVSDNLDALTFFLPITGCCHEGGGRRGPSSGRHAAPKAQAAPQAEKAVTLLQ
jgi:hypothetical protein